ERRFDMADNGRWAAEDIPDQSARTVVVTGGNSGIGYEAALEFAGKGAKVILGCRDAMKAGAAADAIPSSNPRGTVEPMELALASLASVRSFADAFGAAHPKLDILCNNAGVMALPYRKTADGFEMQIGTNHLGHFALTGLLMRRLLAADGSRVVTV